MVKTLRLISLTALLAGCFLAAPAKQMLANEPNSNLGNNRLITPAYLYLKAPNSATSSLPAIIAVHTGGQAINIIQARVNFAADQLQATELKLSSSTCPLVIQQTIDNQKGELNIICAMPTPGFNGDNQVAKINFAVIGSGLAEISFSASSSKLLANDGQATNIIDAAIGKTVILTN